MKDIADVAPVDIAARLRNVVGVGQTPRVTGDAVLDQTVRS